MIIGDKKQDVEVVGADTSKKATISQDKMAKLQYLLTKGLYKDPQTAVIAEWANNGVDAIVEAGKNPKENPVIVSFERSKIATNQWIFSVEDKGTGLDDKDFEDVCMNYLESTKDQSDEFIGSFGIGMKSFLSLERHATFTCRKNGRERVYMVYEGEEFVNYTLISDKDTTEENGVRAEMVLNSWSEYNSFVSKAKAKLAYYDTVVIIIDGKPVDNQIVRNDLFQWADLNTDRKMHLCLKDVYYPIDWSSLGISEIHIPIALRFHLGEGITPTPSRESYITTEATKQLILNKIGEVATWFVKKYNSEHDNHYGTFLDAYDEIGNTIHHVIVEGAEFHINEVEKYSAEIVPLLEIDGINLRPPIYYKDKDDDLLYEWVPVGYYSHSKIWKTKSRRMNIGLRSYIFRNKKHPILVSDTPVGNVKEYLKQKYGVDSMFISKQNTRVLGTKKFNDRFTAYNYILNLYQEKKDVRRSLIKEWQYVRDSIASTFIDETNVATSKEYNDWLIKRRADLKAGRIHSSYKGLNKQVGDVTIAYAQHRRGECSFKKQACPIAKLANNQYLTVVITKDDDLEKVKGMSLMKNNSKVIFGLVGNKEIKKIPDSKQFITLNQFIMDSKPFKRLASAILFSKAIGDFEEISGDTEEIFQNCVSSVAEDVRKLEEYVNKNYTEVDNILVEDYILAVAEENDLFDKQLWDVYIRVKEAIKKYDFITCLATPDKWDEGSKKRYKRIISQMLLFRKKYYDDLPSNVEIEVRIVQPAVQEKEENDTEEGEFDEEEIGELNVNLEEATF